MNTEKMSHVVSMTANVGVLIGLSLLVYELNQNNRHLEEQAEYMALQSRVQNVRLRAENADVGRLVYGHLAEQPLTALEESRRLDFFDSTWVEWDWIFQRQGSGLIQHFDSLEQMAAVFRDAIQSWEAQDEWPKIKHYYRADFVEFMDTQVIGPG